MMLASAPTLQWQGANACAVRKVEIPADNPSGAHAHQPAAWPPHQELAAALDAEIGGIKATLHGKHRTLKLHLALTLQPQLRSRRQFCAEMSARPVERHPHQNIVQ